MDTDTKKDFFVSYNRHDKTWAEWIAWTLEEAGYSVVIQAWDFRPGGNFVLDMQRATSQAERTIAVLSQNYLDSQFVQPEWATAFAQDPTGKKRSLIPIRVGECVLTGMLSTIVYVDVVGVEETAAQALVLQAVQERRTKPAQKPSFPGYSEPTIARSKPIYPPHIVQNLPYASQTFVGRDAELEQIHEQLHQQPTTVVLAISGMGGTGKTELALQYARQQCREGAYPGGVCWLRAREDVGAQIISFVRSHFELIPPEDLELLEKVRWCWQRWHEGAALLIFDDVQQYDDIVPFLPPQDSRFKVLLTTRLDLGAAVQELQLDVLSENEAIELLRALVPRSLQATGALEKPLCEWLGYLPLGVELIGRYLARKPDLSLADLWQRLQDKRLDAIAFKEAQPGMTASLGVAAAFELSWQALEEPAQHVATVLSLFALVEIPWTLVEQCLPDMDEEELEEIRDEQLLGAHLLKRVDKGMYRLHQLLREFFASKRSQRADDLTLQQQFYQVVITAAERVKEKPERSQIKESTVAIAHLQAAMERLVQPEQALDVATCLKWIAELYYAQGRYREAEPLLVRSLELREQRLGQEHPDVAQSLSVLGWLYYSQGYFGEAEPLHVRALKIRQQHLGDDHPDVALSLSGLAQLYSFQGRYGEAEPLHVRALEIRQQHLGDNHPDVASSLNTLAQLYEAQGRYGEAEPLHVRSLEIYRRQLGDQHPDVATGLNTLANLYRSQGRYEEAEPLYLRSREIYQLQLGHSHPYVGISLSNLAKLYRWQGRYSEAEPLVLQSLSILRKQLSAEHPRVAAVLYNLARIYDLQGRYSEAESLYLQALPIFSMKLGHNHPSTQSGSQIFRLFLQKVIQDRRTHELSDDPMTQEMLKQLQATTED
ncbi:tetratricopeptide repeat protein [Oscillatoria sp. FACHB-1407]|uniref:tetratricopeptide repeat protein n=1 Tax=Oscillatoria sp. FACHB-1407 TaxID=2692847 RepID=UPI001682D889|nr:toll/interleukin-1 receptor domain-containing protein [Oscillatoria sp. FACHB-1407]MBD2462162.1 tetratricopeptide repeat protein [Oscillatoria sp. FACHB-1407]